MTGEREIKIPAIDVTRVAIACKACGAEIGCDLRNQRQYRVRAESERFICPMCRTEFDARVANALVHLGDWVRLIEESGHVATFRIEDPDDA